MTHRRRMRLHPNGSTVGRSRRGRRLNGRDTVPKNDQMRRSNLARRRAMPRDARNGPVPGQGGNKGRPPRYEHRGIFGNPPRSHKTAGWSTS